MTAVRPEQGPALRAALAALADQDPLIDARSDDDGHVVVSLYGRVQQEVLAATLAEEYGVEAEFSDASVLHVERPRRSGQRGRGAQHRHQPVRRHDRAPDLADRSRVGAELHDGGASRAAYRSSSSRARRRSPLSMERHVARTLEHGLFGWGVTDCRVTLTDIAYASWDGPPSTRGDLPTALDYRKLTPIVLRQALARAGTRVCEPVLRVSLEVPTESTPALQRLLGRWGAELTGPDLARRLRDPRGAAAGRRVSTSSSGSCPT